MRASARRLLAAVGVSTFALAATVQTHAASIEVQSRQIEQFRIGHQQTRFGTLEFVGGLEMVSTARDFGAISSMRFVSGTTFLAVTDTGFWLRGDLRHDAQSRPSGISNARMDPIRDENGNASGEKWTTDAEALAVDKGRATVGFERVHRIVEYDLSEEMSGGPLSEVEYLIPRAELRSNRSFETIAYAPEGSALSGARIVISERSIDENGNIFAAILEGPRKGIFKVKRSDDFDVTDGAFLPSGDLILLERRFSMATGVAMRLRRIAGDTLAKGALVDGPVLLEADMSYQIDNMEAMDVWQRQDGATMISIMSDDNHSILQRNLYLEFTLQDQTD
ncbi:esterase-like activity of phytase family protein [Nitratireductor basaltis]|uniref:ABC-type cobalamin/Fe3+-siderophore transport system, ATPase component n=1 Tax=Nitratireductor basaltis TaxID=472175 RepID=A0A084U7I4_9HYPH|nr:esterase-like activity of phytase family protein [Nitratireductor basaltis]KFB08920.1 ABC-type cobalamin/Fe3+-siderophore transport system, ATPase component [Nitratireductor basaltis]